MKKSIIFSVVILCIIVVIVIALLKYNGQKQNETTQTMSTTTTTTITTTLPNDVENNLVSTSVEITTKQNLSYLQKEKYYEILDLYYDMLIGKIEPQIYDGSVCFLVCAPFSRGEKPLENIGYRIADLNNDGNLELIIGGMPTNEYWPDMIFALYTFVDGEPKMIIESVERSRNYLCSDNYFSNEGSGGAAYSVYFLYKFQGTKLNLEEYLYTDGDNEPYYAENNLSPWYLSSSSEQNPQKDKHLTEDEARLKIKEYRDRRVPLGLKAFETYK